MIVERLNNMKIFVGDLICIMSKRCYKIIVDYGIIVLALNEVWLYKAKDSTKIDIIFSTETPT